MSQIAVNLLSNKFSKLNWKFNYIEGKSFEYFKTLKNFFRFYFIVSLIFISISPFFVFYIKVDDSYSSSDILIISSVLSISVAINFSLMPIYFFLESANKISYAYSLRIASNILSLIIYFILFSGGFNLWAILSSQISQLLFNLYALTRFKEIFLKVFKIKLFNQIIPNKLVIDAFPTYLSGFIINVFSVPIVHNLFGPKISGRFGMSLIIINLLALISISLYQYNIPKMTRYVSNKNISQANNIFRKCVRNFILSFSVLLILFFLILQINFINQIIANRILQISDLFKLSIIISLFNISVLYNNYTRLFLKDIFNKNYLFFILSMILLSFFTNGNLSYFLNLLLILSLVLFFLNHLTYSRNKDLFLKN